MVVPDLLSVQPHTGVWQLVSTVVGRLRDGVGDAELLRATFPPGSVTGAPKSSALRGDRARWRPQPRGAYTGAIGFASPSWGSEFSVAIRTFEIVEDRIELGVGGGITADSVPMLEWRECLDKAAPLLASISARLATEVATAAVAADRRAAGRRDPRDAARRRRRRAAGERSPGPARPVVPRAVRRCLRRGRLGRGSWPRRRRGAGRSRLRAAGDRARRSGGSAARPPSLGRAPGERADVRL